MSIRIQLFAGLADEVGQSTLPFDLPENEFSVGDLKKELIQKHPGAERWIQQSLTSVNKTYAPDTQILQPGDEVSLIPPLSGG